MLTIIVISESGKFTDGETGKFDEKQNIYVCSKRASM